VRVSEQVLSQLRDPYRGEWQQRHDDHDCD
jgi:hypothetical protein